MEIEGLAFVGVTFALGIGVLWMSRRKAPAHVHAARRALDMGHYVDPIQQANAQVAYGRPAQARQILEEALRLNPEHDGIKARLAELR
jgi:Tfp pilus assembly protein FimV